MIKNVFFDLDGTIVDSEPGILEGLKIALTEFGYDIPEYAVLRKCIGPPFLYSFPNLLHIKEADIQPCIDRYRQYYDKENGLFNCSVYDGVEALLQRLVNEGYSLTICSSKPEVTCRKLLKGICLDKYFNDICGSTLDGKIDNKVDVIKLCFKRAPWQKQDETILIGDTKFDVLGAKKAGIDCIGITWGFGTKEDLETTGAAGIFDSCEEVLEYIEKH